MTLRFLMLTVLLATGMAQAAQPVDPPARASRLSYADGDVSFSPAGEDEWYRAQLNRPQVAGDRLWIADRSRAELELGGAALRFDQGTGVEILTLDDRDVQVQLSQGTLNLHVRRMWQGQSYEIATPTLALVVREAGDFRIDVDERGRWTEVVAWRGRADIYGERARFSLHEGEAVRFEDPRLRGYQQFALPPRDSFDRFVDERNVREERALARGYVPEDMLGYADLEEYGRWSNDREYGAVWYPRVAAGWAPYRDGRWIWQDPWGWTWVDNAPWGFAPSHYGRWLRVGSRWAWLPAPVRSRPVYAPALVAFVGGGSGSIGWFPLGPRDVYIPGYRTSQSYFNRVNEYRWIDSRVANDTWNGYSTNRSRYNRQSYSHRDNDSMTMVARDSFVNGRAVSGSRVKPGANFDASAQASALANMAPVQRSLAGGAAAATRTPDDALFDRRVVARRAPQASDVPLERRAQQWQRNPGQPIATDELARMNGSAAASGVQVVGEAATDLRGQSGAGTRSTSGSRRDESPVDAGATRRERGRDTGASDAAQRQAEADRARAGQQAATDAQRAAEQQQRDAERQQQQAAMEEQRQADSRARDGERRQRDADRQQQQAQMDAQRETERQQREAEQQQRNAEQQRNSEQQREAERQQREAERQQRSAEQQRNAEREQQAALEAQRAEQQQQKQQQAEAERAQREADQQQQQAEQTERENRERYEQEQRDREAQRQQAAAEQAQRDSEREQQQAQREAEQAQREAEQAEREAEREQKQQEEEESKRDRGRDEGGDEQPN